LARPHYGLASEGRYNSSRLSFFSIHKRNRAHFFGIAAQMMRQILIITPEVRPAPNAAVGCSKRRSRKRRWSQPAELIVMGMSLRSDEREGRAAKAWLHRMLTMGETDEL
jgi:hypothetical protein